MIPAHHRTLPLVQAVEDFAIDRLLGEQFDDLIGDRLDEDDAVLVFDGDTACAGDLDLLHRGVAFGAPWDRQRHGLIVVDGSLAMDAIDLHGVDGLIVLGDLHCDSLHLREELLYVQGDLVARNAVRATASQDWHDAMAQTLGPLYVHVKGATTSPVVQTWHMPLCHLAWTAGSGAEEPLVLR
jgi:hypothetical protein